ncbi:Rtn protein [Caballeronia sordidicola]|uniref:Rtn protein n=1 Tax=Caballeronia sordidicola TaxID=196367 RepID=A0A242M833_CABSO|nr:Rtn protein [Caballeronia sordidicola]
MKIDRQFLNQVEPGGAELIKGILAVASRFGLHVIAEGVETEVQHLALQAVGVSLGQGYFSHLPLRAKLSAALRAPAGDAGSTSAHEA